MNRTHLRHPSLEWSDFQVVLAIARQASVARACGVLGMSHATLLRRLEQIETRLQTRLFERGGGKYQLTTAGHEISQAAGAIEPLVAGAQTRACGQDLHPVGDVRLSTSSIIATHLLPSAVAQFGSAFPDVRVELITSRDHANMRRRDADVALRMADSVPDWLVGRRLAALRFKVYSRRAVRTPASPRGLDELLATRGWIVFERDAHDQKIDRWLASKVEESKIAMRVDNFTHAVAMVRAGLGMAVLPTFVESDLPDLQPLSRPIDELETWLWLITHPELATTARVQVMMRAFGPALANALSRVPQ